MTCHEQWKIEAHARLKFFKGRILLNGTSFSTTGNLGLAEADIDLKPTQTGFYLKFKVQGM